MPRTPTKNLTALDVKNAQPRENDYKLTDGGGLYLLVKPNGAKYWRLKYRIYGKEKKLAIGVYPSVSLAQARAERESAKKLISEGKDPTAEKRATKQAQRTHHANTFYTVAMEWFTYKSQQPDVWGASYAHDIKAALVNDVFPVIGKIPIGDITPRLLLEILRQIERTGSLNKVRKIRQYCHQIFVYAIALELITSNPASDLASLLRVPKSSPLAHLSVAELPEFLRTLRAYPDNPMMCIAIQLLLLTGVRTQELRFAQWAEFDLDNAVWTIPPEHMKMKRMHLVPLSSQVISLLKTLRTLGGGSQRVFPGAFDANKPRSSAVMMLAVYDLGYKGRTTNHGFRHTMSTLLHEQGFNSAWIEMQLAHVDKNSIRGTYNHAQYLDERRKMMQWYADCMDSLALDESIPALPTQIN